MLESCDLGPEGVAALAASPHLTALRELTLDKNHLGDAGAPALASCNPAAALASLRVYGNEIGPTGRAALEQRFGAECVLVES